METHKAIGIGRIVHYTLGEEDAQQINRRRTTSESISVRMHHLPMPAWPTGAQAHIGNEVKAGDIFPMMVTKVWQQGYVNGQVLLDGTDCFWATSVTEGIAGHNWSWPLRT